MRTLSILLLVATLPACERAPTDPQRGSEAAQTDRPSYTAEYLGGAGTYRTYGFTVVSTLRNISGRTLYLQRFPRYSVQLLDGQNGEGNAYETYYSLLAPENPWPFLPDEVRTDTIHISGPNRWSGDTGQPYGTLEGTFRLRYWLGTCPDPDVFACLAPDSLVVSNPFSVVVNWLP